MMFTWAIYQIPQVIQNYLKKSVVGFSFGLIFFVAIGDAIEFLGDIFLDLPIQSYINNFRGILIFLIYCSQFFKFKKI